MDPNAESQPSSQQPGEVGDLMRRIGDGLKTLAESQIKLAKLELLDEVKKPLASAGAIVLGGVIALFGVGLLCATAVVALEPLVGPLWLRMVIMSAVYFALGRLVMRLYTKRLQADVSPELPRAAHEAKRTVQALKAELTRD